MDALRVKERLETALGAGVTALAPMPVGFGLTGFKVELAGGRRLAVKARQTSARVDLRLEGYMFAPLSSAMAGTDLEGTPNQQTASPEASL